MAAGDDPGEGAADGSPRRGTREFAMSADTSVPRQRDAAESALTEMLVFHAPVGFALFGLDLRFAQVTTAFARTARPVALTDPAPAIAGAEPAATAEVTADPDSFIGHLPTEVWPDPFGTLAEATLRTVLADGSQLTEPGPIASELTSASWFPVRNAS